MFQTFKIKEEKIKGQDKVVRLLVGAGGEWRPETEPGQNRAVMFSLGESSSSWIKCIK